MIVLQLTNYTGLQDFIAEAVGGLFEAIWCAESKSGRRIALSR